MLPKPSPYVKISVGRFTQRSSTAKKTVVSACDDELPMCVPKHDIFQQA